MQAASNRERTERPSIPGILSRIVDTKREEIRRLQGEVGRLRNEAAASSPARDFEGALRRPGEVALIAEVKRRSPGAGPIRPELDPAAIASGYAASGAAAISVLTDRDYFGGGLDDLAAVREVVPVPVLRKDFVLDPLQVLEARAAGADAILLIVRILSDDELVALREFAEELGMGVLVEAHDEPEVRRALGSGARILGINNRDLATFKTRLDTTIDLIPGVPPNVTLVSESGIHTSADVERLGAGGVEAILVGEALLRAPDPSAKARSLSGVPRVERSAGPDVGDLGRAP